ncbi:MAG: hypothetical protein JXB50_08190 [Spirochaetes bacterium]|nr:hypothetical protein [Spirochaetota bacterium]
MTILTVKVSDEDYIKLKYLSKKRKIKMGELLTEIIKNKIQSDIKIDINIS